MSNVTLTDDECDAIARVYWPKTIPHSGLRFMIRDAHARGVKDGLAARVLPPQHEVRVEALKRADAKVSIARLFAWLYGNGRAP